MMAALWQQRQGWPAPTRRRLQRSPSRNLWLLGVGIVVCGLVAWLGSPSWAGPVVQAPLDVEIMIPSYAVLTISPNAILFPDADPDLTPLIPAAENPVQINVRARTQPNLAVTLTVRATTHLLSGKDSIDISNVSWTVSGRGFQPGTLSLTEQPMGKWQGPVVRQTGTVSYFLKNSWYYASGKYQTTAVLTLTAP